METTKIFCGSGKTRTGQYGDFQSVSICLTDLPRDHITTAGNGKKYINLTINKKKEVDQYGKDLSVTVDTWRSDKDLKSAHTSKQEYKPELEDKLPF